MNRIEVELAERIFALRVVPIADVGFGPHLMLSRLFDNELKTL